MASGWFDAGVERAAKWFSSQGSIDNEMHLFLGKDTYTLNTAATAVDNGVAASIITGATSRLTVSMENTSQMVYDGSALAGGSGYAQMVVTQHDGSTTITFTNTAWDTDIVRYMIMGETGVEASSTPIAYWDFGSDKTVTTSSTLTITNAALRWRKA